jgi:hypothetical protein
MVGRRAGRQASAAAATNTAPTTTATGLVNAATPTGSAAHNG